jgi:hypothetical protein
MRVATSNLEREIAMKTSVAFPHCSRRAVLLLAACASLAFAGCSTETRSTPPATNLEAGKRPDGEGRSKLWLTMKEHDDRVAVTVHYEAGVVARPRVADIRLAHSEALELLDATAGSSAEAAGKELTTQKPTANSIRLILLSRDTVELGSGELVRLNLKRVAKGPIKVDFMMDRAVFAPAESLEGLMIGDPVAL